MKVAQLAEANGMRAEVHGGGLANLHLALALPNNTYYEDLVIDPEDVASKKNGVIPFHQGTVQLPDDTIGVGWNLDIAHIEATALDTVKVSL